MVGRKPVAGIVFAENDPDQFVLMFEGIIPAFERGAQKTPDPVRMPVYFLFRGEQIIAQKIHAVVAGIDDVDFDAFLFEIINLVGQVTDHRIGFAVDQVIGVEGVIQMVKSSREMPAS